MAGTPSPGRDSFSGKFGIIAATAGSAIGLGNIWRFPYVIGENGGGAFLIIYLALILGIGIPVMMSELIIGRNTLRNPIGAFMRLKPGKPWFLIGVMGVAGAFTILAFYAAVAGWTLEYIYQSIINGFAGKNTEELANMFTSFREGSLRPVIWFLVFMAMTAGIVISGIKNGIEKYSKILMPLLLVILVILCVRSLTLPGAGEGLRFLFRPDFSKITPGALLQALGQAAFSLSIGMGTLIAYGSYIGKKDNLANTAVGVAMADTFIAILAGVAIFPAVFAFGIDPAAEEGLVFITLPNIFQQMQGGYFFSLIFFILLAVAALTSTISMLEVVVIYFVEEIKMSRKKATILAAISVSALGLLAAGSWGWFSNITMFKNNVFGLLNFTSVNMLLPLGGFFIVIFTGWFMGRKRVKEELSSGGSLRIRFWHVFLFLVRFIAPIAIAIVFLNGIGIIRF
jgi:neurotransmitter:Na+ symporter, NSS family